MALTASDKREHLLEISIVLAFLLPHTSTMFLMVNPILCVLLWLLCRGPKVTNTHYVVCASIAITFMIGFASGVETKAIVRASSIFMYFLLFPFVGDIRVRNGYLIFCLSFIVFSQFATMFSVPYVSSLLDSLYPISEDDIAAFDYRRNTITVETITNYRLGGIFHNSNQCSKYVLFLFVFYLICNSEKTIKQLLPIMALSSLSVFITGSRTGFVTLCTVLFFFFRNRNDVSKPRKVLFSIAAIIVGVYIFINGSDSFRGLNVSRGFDDSLGAKFDALNYYLSTEDSPIRFLLGYLDTSQFKVTGNIMGAFDGEIGVLLFSYGFIGFTSIIVFYLTIARFLSSTNRLYMVILLWMMSSTIIGSYRCSFVFLLLLSVIVSKQYWRSENFPWDERGFVTLQHEARRNKRAKSPIARRNTGMV